MTPHERLMASPAAVNRMAALQLSHDHSGRDELLWEQNERYHTIAVQLREPSFRGDLREHAKLYDAICKLATLKPGTFYFTDYTKHVQKLWARTHGGWRKNSKVRFKEALARARQRYEAISSGAGPHEQRRTCAGQGG